jgi:two-component system chemotaxis response regulator CheY
MALNVLVVDDSAVMRAMIIRTLRVSRLPVREIHEASNGREALALLDREWIDLALVDINMPEMTGEELIDRVRSLPTLSDLPLIVVSTEGSETRIARIRARGAAFVHKPFTPERLRDEIVRLTGVTYDERDEGFAAPGSDLDF